MSSFLDPWRLVMALLLIGGPLLTSAHALAQTPDTTRFPGIGRAATAKEVAAWDIDVCADFKGLPQGSGSVAKGMEVWEAKCTSCRGTFGESNAVFQPIIGGTTAQDILTGRVARWTGRDYPGPPR